MLRPSQAAIVSPAGTVGALGLGAGPQTPLGNADADRAVRLTWSTSKVALSGRAMVTVSVLSKVAEYMGATPSPGVEIASDLGPPGPARTTFSVGAVVT